MGFTQRQAGGKFTSSEADEFIERLQIEIHGGGPPAGSHSPPPTRAPKPAVAKAAPRARTSRRPGTPPETATPLSDVPVEELAAELQRRGWIVGTYALRVRGQFERSRDRNRRRTGCVDSVAARHETHSQTRPECRAAAAYRAPDIHVRYPPTEHGR